MFSAISVIIPIEITPQTTQKNNYLSLNDTETLGTLIIITTVVYFISLII